MSKKNSAYLCYSAIYSVDSVVVVVAVVVAVLNGFDSWDTSAYALSMSLTMAIMKTHDSSN